MRKAFYITILIVLFGVIITGCNVAYNNNDTSPAGESDFRALGISVDGAATIDLIAGQHIDIGDIYIWNDEEFLYIEFNTTDDWYMTETHLSVANSVEGIPQTKKGNPIPGHFPYKAEYEPLIQVELYVIPIEDEWFELGVCKEIEIAAHAAVQQENDIVQEESAWAEGEDFPGKNWATYFSFVVMEPLVYETFDTYAPGSPPVPPWTDYYHGMAGIPEYTREKAKEYGVTVLVDETVYYASGKSLHFLDTSTSNPPSLSIASQTTLVFDQTTKVVVEYYMITHNNEYEGAFVNLYGDAGMDHVLTFYPDGYIRLFANTGWLASLMEYSEDTWYKVRRVLDLTTNTGSFYVEEADNPLNNSGEPYAIGSNAPNTYIDKINIWTSGSQGADSHVDEITIWEQCDL